MTRLRILVLTRHDAVLAIAPGTRAMIEHLDAEIYRQQRRQRALLFALGFDATLIAIVAAAAWWS